MTRGGLIFKKVMLELILKGKKITTIRYDDGFEVGKIYAIRTNFREKAIAHIIIVAKQQKKLKDLTPEDIAREGLRSFEQFQKTWFKCYKKWNPEDTITIYSFAVVGKRRAMLRRRCHE
jgi:hypothetical protein